MREVVEGLQTYLNFTLSTLLLYNFEKEQYDELFSNTYVSKVQENPVSDPPKIQEETVLLQQQPTVPESRKWPSKRKSTRRNKLKHDEDETSESRSSNQAAESAVPQVADSNGGIIMHPPQRKRGRPSRKSKLELLSAQKPIPRRETRATGHVCLICHLFVYLLYFPGMLIFQPTFFRYTFLFLLVVYTPVRKGMYCMAM